MGKKPKYDDEFRAGAIAWLQGAGYPDTPGALERVASELHVPTRTLRRWWTGESNPPPDKVVRRKKLDLAEAIRAELAEIFPAMSTARGEASYKDLSVSAAVLIDKLQLLEGKPTTINEERSGAHERLAHKFNQAVESGSAPDVPRLVN